MSKEQHTPEPWQFTQHLSYFGIYGDTKAATMFHVADLPISKPELSVIDEQRGNARRIVATVNACKDIPTTTLEQGVLGDVVEALQRFVMKAETAATAHGFCEADTRKILEGNTEYQLGVLALAKLEGQA